MLLTCECTVVEFSLADKISLVGSKRKGHILNHYASSGPGGAFNRGWGRPW